MHKFDQETLLVVEFFLMLKLGSLGNWLRRQLVGSVMPSHSFVYEFQVSKANARRIPRDKCNVIRDTHAWDEMRGLCDDEFSIFSMPKAASARERLCAQIEPIPRVHERRASYRVWFTLLRWC